MRLNGYFTIEAAVIFPFITMLVVFAIKFGFKIHDDVLSDSCVIVGSMRVKEAEAYFYNPAIAGVDYIGIIASPLVGDDDDFINNAERKIMSDIQDYYSAGILSEGSKLSETDIDDVITYNKNATTIRAAGRVVQILGD